MIEPAYDGDSRDFTHAGTRYSIVYLRGQNRVQLWYLDPRVGSWVFEHGKDIPPGITEAQAVRTMRRFITEDIDQATYNAILPGK